MSNLKCSFTLDTSKERKERKVVTAFTCDQQTLSKLNMLADKFNVSKSELIRKLIQNVEIKGE